MPAYKRPMQKVLVTGCIVFVIVLSVAYSVQSYLTFSSWFYRRYQTELAHVIAHVEDQVDADDLQECIATGEPSGKYAELQEFLNESVDDFELAYLYISIPREHSMINVCSATSEAERAAGEEDLALLYESFDGYSDEDLKPYLAAWNASGITYFEELSGWGYCYTATKPIRASNGTSVALLSADVYVDDLHAAIRSYMARDIGLTVAVGTLFAVLLVLWLRRNVTSPIHALERSTYRFAQKSRESKDPSALLFDDPHIQTENEVEGLSVAIIKMSEEIRDYVEDIVEAERRAVHAEEEAQDMSRIAYQDALTHVKSKAAYELRHKELEEDLGTFGVEFAIVMIDLNDLKTINDTYGHERGDEYLIGTCDVVCSVFRRSPVYRVGGDEFVVLLQGRDYERRNDLVARVETALGVKLADATREPWQRYSAAVGMAEYDPERDSSYDDVFRRADQAMYERKAQMKAGRWRA